MKFLENLVGLLFSMFLVVISYSIVFTKCITFLDEANMIYVVFGVPILIGVLSYFQGLSSFSSFKYYDTIICCLVILCLIVSLFVLYAIDKESFNRPVFVQVGMTITLILLSFSLVIGLYKTETSIEADLGDND